SLLPVFGPERGGRDGDALAAHVVQDIDLIGQGTAGEDLEHLEGFFQSGSRWLLRHQCLDGFTLESHGRVLKNRGKGVPRKIAQYKGASAGALKLGGAPAR